MNPIKQYTTSIERQLKLPRATRNRVMNDLAGDIHARLEAGALLEDIIAELGSPEQVAAGFNEAFADQLPRGSRWRWVFLAAAVVAGGICLFELAVFLWMEFAFRFNDAASVGIIGGADGPTAIFVTGVGMGWAEYLPLCLGCLCGYRLFTWNGLGTRSQYKKAALLAAGAVALWAVLTGAFVLEWLRLADMGALSLSVTFAEGDRLRFCLSQIGRQMFSANFILPVVMLVLSLRAWKKAEK